MPSFYILWGSGMGKKSHRQQLLQPKSPQQLPEVQKGQSRQRASHEAKASGQGASTPGMAKHDHGLGYYIIIGFRCRVKRLEFRV